MAGTTRQRRSGPAEKDRSRRKRRIAVRTFLVVLSVLALYGVLPELARVWSRLPKLGSITWPAFALAALCQAASWFCTASLDRVVLGRISWGAAYATALVTNAVSNVIPAAGGAVGIGLDYRMWEAAGVDADDAARATAAATLLSLATLFALPALTLIFAFQGMRVPETLLWVAGAGVATFAVMFSLGAVLLFADAPLDAAALLARHVARHFGKRITPQSVRRERDDLRRLLGRRWRLALTSAVGIWLFDYLALVAVLYGLGARPHLSLVLLAFTAAKILGMIPITPGGLGVVEAGLSGLLAAIGIPFGTALVATLGYRVVSYWLSLPVGLGAWMLFKSRYPAVTGTAAHRG